MEEEDGVIEHLERAEEKLEEIKEHNGDPGDPETSKNIKQAETMVTTLRKDKQLTLKKLVKLKQIVGYMIRLTLRRLSCYQSKITFKYIFRRQLIHFSHSQRILFD